ncbi:MAG: hypothetical protein ACAH65_04540, partial [Chloroflexota bacterium]
MPDHENEAELLDDRITLLAPGGRLGGASLAPARNAWPWPAVAVVGVLAAGLFALDSRPGGIVGTASPSLSGPLAAAPTTSAIEVPIGPTPEVAPATQDDGPCGTGRIEVEPVIEPVPADSIGPIRPPAGGMLATAIEQGDTQGSIVVSKTASDGATLSRVVATFSGREIQDPSGVTVVGWTAAGDRFLVQAAHDSGFSADRACANLFMVYADGSGVRYLTDNGPGHWIEAATLAPRTAQIAFVDAGQLRVTDTEAPDGTAKIAPCAAPGLVRWSPDEHRLLAVCDGNELVVVGATETPKILPIAR